MSMRAAESRTLTAGSAFNEPVWATVLLDRRLSQATMIGIKGEGCRPGEQTHAVLLGRRTFAAPPADEGRQLKAGPLSMSHRTLWICPSRGRPLSVAPTPEVGEAGAHRPLEISRAIVAAHACVGTARFPQLHSASSSSIHQRRDGRRGRDFGTGIHLNEALEWSKPPGPPQVVSIIGTGNAPIRERRDVTDRSSHRTTAASVLRLKC